MLATDLETLVLEHARRGLGPSVSQRRLTLERLGVAFEALPSTLGAPDPAILDAPLAKGPPDSGASGAGGPAATGVGPFSLQALVAGVLAGALVGFGAGVMTGSAVAPSAALSATPRGQGTATLEHGPREKRERAEAEGQPVAELPQRASEPPAAPLPREAARAPGASAQRGASPPPSASAEAAEATFYEELSYVRRAQSALQRGNAILALGLMQSLDEVRPSGALMAERRMTRVLALCQLERSAEATAVARGMLSGDGTTDVYRRRLASSCARASLSEAAPQPRPVKDPVEGNTKHTNSRPVGHEQEPNP